LGRRRKTPGRHRTHHYPANDAWCNTAVSWPWIGAERGLPGADVAKRCWPGMTGRQRGFAHRERTACDARQNSCGQFVQAQCCNETTMNGRGQPGHVLHQPEASQARRMQIILSGPASWRLNCSARSSWTTGIRSHRGPTRKTQILRQLLCMRAQAASFRRS
jgi:hypothetical protein